MYTKNNKKGSAQNIAETKNAFLFRTNVITKLKKNLAINAFFIDLEDLVDLIQLTMILKTRLKLRISILFNNLALKFNRTAHLKLDVTNCNLRNQKRKSLNESISETHLYLKKI